MTELRREVYYQYLVINVPIKKFINPAVIQILL